MNGTEYYPVDRDGFFAILKDGSAVIGTQAEYETYKGQIQDAIGGFGAVLVKDGKVNVTKSSNYTSNRASRTAVGIKADGSVVMMVLDGRQLPRSAGGAMEEIAEQFGFPVYSIVDVYDIIEYLEEKPENKENVERIKNYLAVNGAKA